MMQNMITTKAFKNFKMHKAASALVACFLVTAFASADLAYAQGFGYSSGYDYTYDLKGGSIAAPQYYDLAEKLEFGLSSPTDLFIAGDEMYVMDGVNGRFIIIDIRTGELISSVVIEQDSETPLDVKDANGIFVTSDKDVYIAFYEQRKIAVADKDGKIIRVIGKPEDDTIPENYEYKPKRVVVHSDELIYVVADGSYQGIVQMDLSGNFLSFFGSNKVSATLQTLLNVFWRRIFSDSQRDRLQKSLPTDYSSIALGRDGFLYS